MDEVNQRRERKRDSEEKKREGGEKEREEKQRVFASVRKEREEK